MASEEELYEHCIGLSRQRNDLLEKLEKIINYLYKTHITTEEFEEVMKIGE